jgi:hypothetical protein
VFDGVEGVLPNPPIKLPALAVQEYGPDAMPVAPDPQPKALPAAGPVAKEGEGAAPTGGITSETGLYSYDLERGEDDGDDDPAEVAKELLTFRRYSRGRRKAGEWRDFRFEHVTSGEARRLNEQGRASVAKDGAPGLTSRSGMISLDLPDGLISPVPGGLTDHHVTICYLGPDVDDELWTAVSMRAREAAMGVPGPLDGTVSGIGAFPPSGSSDGKVPVWAAVAIPGAEGLREALGDLSASEHKNWSPHCTLTYLAPGEPLPAPLEPVEVTFTHLSVHRGDEVIRFPFGGGGAAVVAKAGGPPKAPPGNWPGWALDLRTAAYWAPKVTAAAQQALSRGQLDGIAAAYAADHPGQDGKATGKRDRNAAALAWLLARGVKVPMQDHAGGITADSVLIGGASAQASAAGEDDAETGDWTPGGTSSAKQQAEGLGLAALLAALLGGDGKAPAGSGEGGGEDLPDVAGEMEEGYLNVVSRVLAGWDPDVAADELAGMLAEAVADGAYAEALTVTQITMVAGQAALQWYLSNNVMLVRWITERDDRVCRICLTNEADDPRLPGIPFSSGDTAAPIHPRCRCAVIPAEYSGALPVSGA